MKPYPKRCPWLKKCGSFIINRTKSEEKLEVANVNTIIKANTAMLYPDTFTNKRSKISLLPGLIFLTENYFPVLKGGNEEMTSMVTLASFQ